MEGKKISFGFMKTKKVDKAPIQEKKEFIECLEEQSIKIVGGEDVQDDAPLVIPMKPNTLVTAERLKEIAIKVESALDEPIKEEPPTLEETLPENETIDQMVVRELLQDAKKEIKVESQELSVPVLDKTVIDGQKESSLEDYEAVPIQQFGLAMLRGMGWTPGKDESKYKQPQLRPKGLGLGADKVISEKQKKKVSKDSKGEDLSIVKNSFVKITTGKHSGYYGKVVSLDEDNGRVMVDITVKKETVSLSEFMMQPVTKAEFDKESKVINAGIFEEYKKNEKLPQKSSKNPEKGGPSRREEISTSSSRRDDMRNDYNERENDRSNGRSKEERRRRDSSSSEERHSRRKEKKDKKRYSSHESLSSISDSDRKKKKKKDRRRRSSSSPEMDYRRSKRSPTPEGKRDIDKKRKGKKKKRDRDRSPNHRKHRK